MTSFAHQPLPPGAAPTSYTRLFVGGPLHGILIAGLSNDAKLTVSRKGNGYDYCPDVLIHAKGTQLAYVLDGLYDERVNQDALKKAGIEE